MKTYHLSALCIAVLTTVMLYVGVNTSVPPALLCAFAIALVGNMTRFLTKDERDLWRALTLALGTFVVWFMFNSSVWFAVTTTLPIANEISQRPVHGMPWDKSLSLLWPYLAWAWLPLAIGALAIELTQHFKAARRTHSVPFRGAR